jgi:succinate-semialdehyde dehydrogenase/glutarate-semialdehyde dehydrogenase
MVNPVSSQSSRTFAVINPATGASVGEVINSGVAEAHAAADASAEAFATWRHTTPYARAELLHRWHAAILANTDELARLMSLEMGKPITEAIGEVRYAAGFVSFYAAEATRAQGEQIASHASEKRLFTNRRPVGPVYAITPWNFPAAMVTRKAAPALAAGCTMILKPAEQTPFTALRLAELWQEVGGPVGTLQVLPTADPVPVSAVLMNDVRIRKITFTGSTAVGMQLYAQAAPTMKRLSLELGGHAPFLVFNDADVALAVREVVAAKFRNAGQTCVCANRIYVQAPLYDAFIDAFAAAVRSLRVGDPLDPATQVGPLVSAAGLNKVVAHVDDAVARGARVVVGGTRREGLYYAPTVLADVRAGMRILEEETFGPVAPVLPFRDEAEGIALANATPFGLAAYCWTRDVGRAFRVSEALEYGLVGINDGIPSTPQAPFGGVKLSGIGREGGRWGLDEYLDTQFVSLGLPPSPAAPR